MRLPDKENSTIPAIYRRRHHVCARPKENPAVGAAAGFLVGVLSR